ncbi:MAG TPA: hypothetical protein VKD21_11455 [Acidimicrobiales bacterium]|nr:hypothetical protein [Acidimicrobiales bacterium]
MKKRNAVVALALTMAIAMGSAACGDDDDGGDDAAGTGGDDNTAEHSRDDYVALLGGGGEGMTDDEANCISAAVVDVVGVDALEQANAWDRFQEDPDGSLADYGVVVSEAQVTAIADGVGACVDAQQLFQEMFATGEDLSPELASCLASGIDAGTLHQAFAITIAKGEAALDADPTFTADVEQAALDCAAQGVT